MKIRRGIWCGRVGSHDVGLYNVREEKKKMYNTHTRQRACDCHKLDYVPHAWLVTMQRR